MEGHVAICQDCDWEKVYPKRDMAEHAKTAHEREYGHAVTLDG